MPSDHVIRQEAQFVEAVRRAAKVAETGRLVLFGIQPSGPHTGNGYIRQGAPLVGGEAGAYAVDAFFEKPNQATAESYVAAGNYFWNSGIFVLGARTFLDELQKLEPAIHEAAKAALAGVKEDLGFLQLDCDAIAQGPNISIDYAVMEKTRLAAMLPVDIGWSDVGSWSSLWDIAPHNENGNYVNGDALLVAEKSRATGPELLALPGRVYTQEAARGFRNRAARGSIRMEKRRAIAGLRS